jgi:hypothetical protein
VLVMYAIPVPNKVNSIKVYLIIRVISYNPTLPFGLIAVCTTATTKRITMLAVVRHGSSLCH